MSLSPPSKKIKIDTQEEQEDTIQFDNDVDDNLDQLQLKQQQQQQQQQQSRNKSQDEFNDELINNYYMELMESDLYILQQQEQQEQQEHLYENIIQCGKNGNDNDILDQLHHEDILNRYHELQIETGEIINEQSNTEFQDIFIDELIDNYYIELMETDFEIQHIEQLIEIEIKSNKLLKTFFNGNSNKFIFPLKINDITIEILKYYNILDVSEYNFVFQIDHKFLDKNYYIPYSYLKPPPLYSIIQVLSIYVRNGEQNKIESYRILSSSFKYLIHKNYHPQNSSISKTLNQITQKIKTDEFEILLQSNVNGRDRVYEISNYIFSNIEKRKQEDSISLIEISNYLLSKLNLIIEIGYGVEEIYIEVLSRINKLETVNSIHSHYIKICNEYCNNSSEYISIINNLIGLFDNSIWSIKNNIMVNEDYEYQIKVIQNYSMGGGIINKQNQQPEQSNQGIIKVYDIEVFDYGKTIKPDLYCNGNIFSTDNIRNIKELEFRVIEFKENEDTHPLYKPFYTRPDSNGCYSINPKLSLFKKCFSIFTNGLFDQDFNWNVIVDENGEVSNDSTTTRVIVSGSTVLACLDCLPIEIKREYCRIQSVKRLFYKSRLPKLLVSRLVAEDEYSLNQLLFNRFHDIKSPYFDSDIDLWIITDNVEQGKKMLNQVANQLLSNLKKKPDFNHDEYTFIRTASAITLISKYPYRQIQIMITFYQSEKEVISFFDIDCVKSYYDGSNVYMLPRTVNSFNTRSNLIKGYVKDIRSAKYVMRGFRNIYFKPYQNQKSTINNKIQKNFISHDLYFGFNSFINLLYSPDDDEHIKHYIEFKGNNEQIMKLFLSNKKDEYYGQDGKCGNLSEYTTFYRRYEPGLEFSETIQSLQLYSEFRDIILSISSDLNHLISTGILELTKDKYTNKQLFNPHLKLPFDKLGFSKASRKFFNINYSSISNYKEISICNNIDVRQTGIQLTGQCIVCDETVEVDSPLKLINDDIICCIYDRTLSDGIYSSFNEPTTRVSLNQKNVLILGGRNKLGFEVAFHLLNIGFNVTITTRYPELALKEFQLKFNQHGYSSNLSRLSIIQVNFKQQQQDNSENEDNESINNFITIVKSQFTDKPIHMLLNFIHVNNNQNENKEENQFLNSVVPVKIIQELSLSKIYYENDNDGNCDDDDDSTKKVKKYISSVFIIYDINGNINSENFKLNQYQSFYDINEKCRYGFSQQLNSILILSPSEIERKRFSIFNNNGTTTTNTTSFNIVGNRINCFKTIPNSKSSQRIVMKLYYIFNNVSLYG